MRRTLIPGLVLLVLACGAHPPAPPPSPPPSPTPTTAATASNDVCTQGRYQSPIDLHAVARRGDEQLRFDYRPDALRIVNDGHTVKVEHHAASVLHVGEQTYALRQYHVHTPSEHTVEGKRYPLEIHFVHEDERGVLAVVGVLVEEGVEQGSEHAAASAVFEHLPTHAHETTQVAAVVDPLDLMPTDHTHYFYRGSLTTPPCTESVLWHVLAQPIPLSPAHLDAFRALYADNARPVQRPDWCPLHAPS